MTRATGVQGGPADGDDPEIAELTGRLHLTLARLSRLLRRESPSTLGQSSLSTLSTLSTEGPLRAGDLAVREGVRPPTMTRLVAHLEGIGYVRRLVDPADRRAFLVSITDAGSDYLAGMRSARATQLAAHLAELTPAQRRAISAALPALEALTAEALPAHR